MGEIVWKTLHFDTYGAHELQVSIIAVKTTSMWSMISLVYPESGGMALSIG